jgi:hypothetical protein
MRRNESDFGKGRSARYGWAAFLRHRLGLFPKYRQRLAVCDLVNDPPTLLDRSVLRDTTYQ